MSLGFNFFSLQSWEWMGEEMIFGVVQPENGQIGYCVVLGKEHPFPGLAVFKEEMGLYTYLSNWKANRQVTIDNCMLLSFEELTAFWKEEQELFDWLEIEPQELYPMVREYNTGMEPWPLEDEEKARLMTFAMEQSISLAIRFKQERMLSEPFDMAHNRMMIRAPSRKGAMLLWKDQWKDVKEDLENGSHDRATELF